MQISFLLVTKNRPAALAFTLEQLKPLLDFSKHEVLVFIDGCEATAALVPEYDWVQWEVSSASISASPARNALYKKAKGKYFIGLDDDAHPISAQLIEQVEALFNENELLGIIAFQEVKGIYASDAQALQQAKKGSSFLTNEFIGCGFAVRKSVYEATHGFPTWMTIYGEETAVSFEVLDLGYAILYANDLVVNHRVDRDKRALSGRNYYRFEHQLRNGLRLYFIYYPNPSYVIAKLLVHNFKKYALKDFHYFRLFFKVVFGFLFCLGSLFKLRKPIKKTTLDKARVLRGLSF